jgi:hypothetical protein
MELVPIFSRPTGCTRKPGTHRFPINPAHPHPRARSNNSSDFYSFISFKSRYLSVSVSWFVVPTKKLVFPLCPAPPIRTMDRLTSLCSRPCPRPLFLVLYKTSEPDRQTREPPLHVEGRFVHSADAAQHLRRV